MVRSVEDYGDQVRHTTMDDAAIVNIFDGLKDDADECCCIAISTVSTLGGGVGNIK